MAAQGTTTIAFGSGLLDASVVVSGQTGLLTTNLVEAWPAVSNGDDSPWIEGLKCYAGNIVADTGSGGSFTIYAKPQVGMAFGNYTICWVWN